MMIGEKGAAIVLEENGSSLAMTDVWTTPEPSTCRRSTVGTAGGLGTTLRALRDDPSGLVTGEAFDA
jgi:hypothetical protein